MQNVIPRTPISLGLAGLTPCASTTYHSSWKAPDAQPLGSLKGQKIAAVVLTKNQAHRRSAEDSLARALSANGALGTASYTILGEGAAKDEAAARPCSRRPASWRSWRCGPCRRKRK